MKRWHGQFATPLHEFADSRGVRTAISALSVRAKRAEILSVRAKRAIVMSRFVCKIFSARFACGSKKSGLELHVNASRFWWVCIRIRSQNQTA